jgi:hypothetical protein
MKPLVKSSGSKKSQRCSKTMLNGPPIDKINLVGYKYMQIKRGKKSKYQMTSTISSNGAILFYRLIITLP